MKGPTRIPFPPLPSSGSGYDRAGVQRAIIAAAVTAAVLAFLAGLQELRNVRADLAEVRERLAAVEARKAAPAAVEEGYESVQDLLGLHAREVIEQPRDGEVIP
jgi:hypothetical protein